VGMVRGQGAAVFHRPHNANLLVALLNPAPLTSKSLIKLDLHTVFQAYNGSLYLSLKPKSKTKA